MIKESKYGNDTGATGPPSSTRASSWNFTIFNEQVPQIWKGVRLQKILNSEPQVLDPTYI